MLWFLIALIALMGLSFSLRHHRAHGPLTRTAGASDIAADNMHAYTRHDPLVGLRQHSWK